TRTWLSSSPGRVIRKAPRGRLTLPRPSPASIIQPSRRRPTPAADNADDRTSPLPRMPIMPRAALLTASLSLAACAPAKAQISFYTAVDLALRNSHEVKMAAADV